MCEPAFALLPFQPHLPATALVKASTTNSPGKRGFSISSDGFKDKRGVGNITRKPSLFISNMVKKNKSKGSLIHKLYQFYDLPSE